MRPKWLCLFLFCFLIISGQAQDTIPITLNIGDPAPPLQLRAWLKGEPVTKFMKGRVYVVEFWATWCKPCKTYMPHLSALAREYKNSITFIGVDIMEKETTTPERIREVVDSLSSKMDYAVATDDNKKMETGWIDAAGEKTSGIPRTFVVDANGMLVWIGHPYELTEVLPKIVNNSWDIKEALANRNQERYLNKLEDEIGYDLYGLVVTLEKRDSTGNPESVISMIDELVRKEPALKYGNLISSYYFTALLKTDTHKALEYGRQLLARNTFRNSLFNNVISSVEWLDNKIRFPESVYQLVAEAYQTKIDLKRLTDDVPSNYYKMADWYWRASNKPKAIEAIQAAKETLKKGENASKVKMTELESRFRQYSTTLLM